MGRVVGNMVSRCCAIGAVVALVLLPLSCGGEAATPISGSQGGQGGDGGQGGQGGEPAHPPDPCAVFDGQVCHVITNQCPCCNEPGCVSIGPRCVSADRLCYFRACDDDPDEPTVDKPCPTGMECVIGPSSNSPDECYGAETCLAARGYCEWMVP